MKAIIAKACVCMDLSLKLSIVIKAIEITVKLMYDEFMEGAMRRLTFLITIAAIVVSCFPVYGLDKTNTNVKPRHEKLRIFGRNDEFFRPKKTIAPDTLVFSKG